MSRRDDLICFKHDEIISICKEIKNLDLDKATQRKKIATLINKIIKITEQAKEDGQHMEDRLQEYYNAIDDLGFDRKKKK